MKDTNQILKCPACQKDMVKIFVPQKGVNIDICLNGCGGMWFDNRELSYFDEQDEKIDEILESITNKTFDSVEQNKKRSCPACGANLVKNFSSVKREIQIDECYSCGGKFLDNSELQQFRQEYITEKDRSDDTVKFMYSIVGAEMKELDKKIAENEKNRSLLKRIFDKMIYR